MTSFKHYFCYKQKYQLKHAITVITQSQNLNIFDITETIMVIIFTITINNYNRN